MESQRFCVRWNSYKTNLQTAFPKLLTSEHFVDVTLACEKQFLKCHKVVLSACSVYFEDLLVNNPCPHPIIFMKDVAFWEMKALVEFMYKGEVNVSQEQLDSLLKSAESLLIRGLSGAKKWVDDPNPEPKKKVKVEEESQKSVQITTCPDDNDDDSVADIVEQDSDVKGEFQEESMQELEDSAYMDNTDDDAYQSDDVYQDASREAGPSGANADKHHLKDMENITEFISLEDLKNPHLEPQPAFKSQLMKMDETMNLRAAMSIAVKRQRRRSSYKQYTANSMWAALQKIEKGLSVYRASIEYGVPRKTLRNWMKKYNIMSHFDLRKQTRVKTESDGESKEVFLGVGGPSVKIDLTSLALNSVECVMEQQDRVKDEYNEKMTDHNYTNSLPETVEKVSVERLSQQRIMMPPTPTIASFRSIAPKPPCFVTTAPLQPQLVGDTRPRAIRKDAFNRIRRSEAELGKAAEMVRGGMTFQNASDTFNIPISTIRFYMARRGILPQRRRGRGSSGQRDDDLIHPPFEIVHYRLPDIDKPV